MAYYALAWVFIVRRRLRLGGAAAAAPWMAGIVLFLATTGSTPRPNGLVMTALNVDHGMAVVLRYPDGSTLLYDCGTYGRWDVGRTVVAARALVLGRAADRPAGDSARRTPTTSTGSRPCFERFPIGRVLHSPILGQAHAGSEAAGHARRPRHFARDRVGGDRFELGRGYLLEVLSPADWTLLHRHGDQNENCLVLRAAYGGRSIFLGGDLQRAGAAVLTHGPLNPYADVLVVPHHGCEMKHGDAFARAVRPAYAICSNRAAHLAPSTFTHFQDVGAAVLATCWEGAVTVKIDQGAMTVELFRHREKGGLGSDDEEPLSGGISISSAVMRGARCVPRDA